MKVIFLDFDGVLNSRRTVAAYGCYGFLGFRDGYHLDPVALKMVEVLCKDTSASIVISSSWRIGADLQEFKDLFDHYKIDVNVVGFTPRSYEIGEIRGHEIEAYLVKHPQITHYAILDDDSDMLETQKAHFVHVNPTDGLSWKNFEQAKKILL